MRAGADISDDLFRPTMTSRRAEWGSPVSVPAPRLLIARRLVDPASVIVGGVVVVADRGMTRKEVAANGERLAEEVRHLKTSRLHNMRAKPVRRAGEF